LVAVLHALGVGFPLFEMFREYLGGLLFNVHGSHCFPIKVIFLSKKGNLSYTQNHKLGTVNCFLRMGRSIVLGTEDDGILFWDPIKNLVQACASEQGLSSDFIFSLYKLDSLTVLAGTGKGISRIHLEKKSQGFLVRNFTSSFDPYGPECNLNSVLRAENNKIWVGTTKGIYIYNANDPPVAGSSPLIYLNSVSLFSKKINSDFQNDTLYAWSLVPKDLRLTNRQNHLTFDFNGVFFSNPKGLNTNTNLRAQTRRLLHA